MEKGREHEERGSRDRIERKAGEKSKTKKRQESQ